MALTNYERVGRALDLLKTGLGPFVEREVHAHVKANGMNDALERMSADDRLGNVPISDWDAAALLKTLTHGELWKVIFGKTLGHAERSYASEVRRGAQHVGASGHVLGRRHRARPRYDGPPADVCVSC